MQIQFDFTKNISKKKLEDFAGIMRKMQESIDFKVSARGWGYLMEQDYQRELETTGLIIPINKILSDEEDEE